jgi:hypothetical protein
MRDISDDVDKANELALLANEHAVYTARQRAKPEQVPNPDGSWPVTDCTDCGEVIETGRVHLGKIRCFTCQTLKEGRRP